MFATAASRRTGMPKPSAPFGAFGVPVVALFLLLAGILPSVPSGAAAEALPSDLSPEEAEWLRSRPVIRFGADPSWLPFSVRSGDRIEGVDQDMIELFGKRLGIRFEYVPTESWGDTLAKLRKGEIDFVSGIADLPERPLGVRYTRPYASFPVALIMRTDGPFHASLEQIQRDGLVLAGPSAYAPTVHIEQHFPKVRLVRTGTSLEALRLVSEGRADAMVENLGVAAHLIRTNGLGNLKIAGTTPYHFDPAFGVREDLPALHAILEKSLASVTEAERLAIYERWVLVDLSRLWDWRRVLFVAAVVAGIAIAGIGLVALWNRRLGQELERRQAVEESLRRSEERFRHLFETMEDAYLLTQEDGRIQFVNETAVTMLGIGSRTVVERLGIAAFLRRPEDFSRLAGRLREEGSLRDHPVEFVRADGSPCHCRCSIRLLEDEAGTAIGIEWRAFGFSGAGGDS